LRTPENTAKTAVESPDFVDVYDNQFSYVWSSLSRLGVADQDLEDVAQEVFEHVLDGLENYDPTRALRPWLFGVALAVVRDHRKRLWRRREVGFADDRMDSRPLPDRVAEQNEEGRLVARALESLEINRRAVFVMSELYGHTMPEIAETLAVPLNTAYSRLRLARRDFEVAVRQLRMPKEAP
jgi:RNA polymerase sigma-70 factor (ECF subfamily)